MITYIVVGMYITLFSIPCGVYCYYVKKTKIMPSGCPISYKEVLSNKHKTNYLLQTRRIQITPQIVLNPIDKDSETSDEDSETSDEDSVISSEDSVTSDKDSVISGEDSVISDKDSVISDKDSVISDEKNQLQTLYPFGLTRRLQNSVRVKIGMENRTIIPFLHNIDPEFLDQHTYV